MNKSLSIIALLSMATIVAGCVSSKKSPWRLVWSDEFNYQGLPDTAKWNYDVGSDDGWGNNELEYYTYRKTENARVEDSMLVIEARREKIDSFNYTSARLVTRGRAAWQYGKIEVRAKLPEGMGHGPPFGCLPIA